MSTTVSHKAFIMIMGCISVYIKIDLTTLQPSCSTTRQKKREKRTQKHKRVEQVQIPTAEKHRGKKRSVIRAASRASSITGHNEPIKRRGLISSPCLNEPPCSRHAAAAVHRRSVARGSARFIYAFEILFFRSIAREPRSRLLNAPLAKHRRRSRTDALLMSND